MGLSLEMVEVITSAERGSIIQGDEVSMGNERSGCDVKSLG